MADTPISPKTLVTNGAPVSTSNPLPCTAASAGTPAMDVAVSPVTWVVNGDIISTSNPLPISLS